jgi:hypothetical protein
MTTEATHRRTTHTERTRPTTPCDRARALGATPATIRVLTAILRQDAEAVGTIGFLTKLRTLTLYADCSNLAAAMALGWLTKRGFLRTERIGSSLRITPSALCRADRGGGGRG